tara:strand:- start:1941 stop:3239 length:1299 start_codon:yes stop_codon:yes gene_type:complete
MYKITNNDEINDNDYNSNNVRNQIKNREPFAEGEGGYLYKEKYGKVRKVFKSKFAFEGESKVYEKTDGLPNVVKVYKILKRNMHIIMEFVPYNLENLIVGKEKKSFDEFDKNKIVNELISGLISLHDRKIYHNDYKSKNIQITANSGVRIIDFDLSDFGIENSKKRIEEINKLKYIILQILYNTKYYPDTFNNRNKYLQQIDDKKFKKVMAFKRDNLKEMQKYMATVDFNNSGTLVNGAVSLVSGMKKIYYLEKPNTNKPKLKENEEKEKLDNVIKKLTIEWEQKKEDRKLSKAEFCPDCYVEEGIKVKPSECKCNYSSTSNSSNNNTKVKKQNDKKRNDKKEKKSTEVKKQNTSSKLTKSILDKFFTEFKFKNEKECSSGSHSSSYFVKKPVLIKTINKKYPEIRAALPHGYQKLSKDKLCEELYKLRKNI